MENIMINNYFKLAWRNLMKHKFISAINLAGLAIGFTCCLLICTYILHETSFDKYNANANRIYRVTRNFNNPDGAVTLRLSTIAPAFGPLLNNAFPEIQKMTRFYPTGITPVKYGDKLFNETQLFFADENVFGVFDINVTKGNPARLLVDPFTVMLSEKIASKYFGTEDPMNKVIRVNSQYDLKVSGVFKSFPSNAHIHPEMMVSFNTLKDSAVYGARNLETSFGNNSFFTYLLLPEKYPYKQMEARFPSFLDKDVHFPGVPAGYRTSMGTQLGLQKLTDIHLTSHTDFEAEENGDIKRVYVFSVIALVILLIACINYMNLSTARSALRAKEIGIRKVAGARKGELVIQFLAESVLITGISLLLAFGLTYLFIPYLNELSGQALTVSLLFNWKWITLIAITPIMIGILAGFYPAWFLSSFKPVNTLKGLFKASGSSVSFRKVLVVTQFGISIVLIITTAIVFQQLNYMQQAKLGYNKDHIIVLPYNFTSNSQYESFRNELLSNSGNLFVGRSSRIPTGRLLDSQGASAESGDSLRPVTVELKYLATDQDFIPAYGISMAAGRNFSRAFGTDTSNFVMNEASVRVLGWKSNESAIGKNFRYGNVKGKVIGVTRDFHFESMHQKIVPMVMTMPKPERSGMYNQLTLKIDGRNTASTLAFIEKTWRNSLPEVPFEYSFLDDNYQKLYVSELKQGKLFTLFACIAIFIACLGLLGLSAFSITQRIKEIGIRKVLGASVSNIVILISGDFLKLVVIASVIAFPVAWYAMHQWLSDYAYRIDISWWVFLVAGILAAMVALLTVSVQAIRAASANPEKSLRTE